MANPFDQFDVPSAASVPVPKSSALASSAPTQINPFDQFDAPAGIGGEGMPGSRRSYAVSEIPGAAMRNLPSSAGQFAGGIYTAVTSPIETAKGIFDTLAGGLRNITPDAVKKVIDQIDKNPAAAARATETANAVGGMFKDRYGDTESLKRTLAEDPVGAFADLSTLLSGGAAVAGRVAPTVATSLTTAARYTNPLTAATAPIKAVAKSKFEKRQAAQLESQVRDDTLKAAQAEGYVVTPGSVNPNVGNILVERLGGKTRVEQLMASKNQQVTDKLARQAVGLPENAPLNFESMADIRRAEYAKGYEPVKNLGRIAADDTYLDDLSKVEDKYTGPNRSFPGATPEPVKKLMETYVQGEFNANDAVTAIQTLRENSRAAFRRGDNELAFAQKDIANALENQIERSLAAAGTADAQAILQQFRDSRRRMAVSHAVEDAIIEGTGSVDARKLASDLQKGKLLTGELETAAKFANTFKTVNKTPGSVGTPAAQTFGGMGFGTRAAMGATAGGVFGDIKGALIGAAAATIPEAIASGAQRYMMSPMAQNRLAPAGGIQPPLFTEFSDPRLRNMLLMQQAGELEREKVRRNMLAR